MAGRYKNRQPVPMGMDIFGNTDSRKMPGHLFRGAIHVVHETAIRGNPGKQNYSVCPRHWYVDADFRCEACGKEFAWTAGEQKAWFEDYFFWVDSTPRHCRKCMAGYRHLQDLRREYDASIAEVRKHGTPGQKRRMIEVVTELESAFGQLPEKMSETRKLFERQIVNITSNDPVSPSIPS